MLAQFTEVAAGLNLNTSGAKDGGVAWGDFNDDGCLDLIVNTSSAVERTRLYLSDCNLPNPGFTDVTISNANGLLSNTLERSVVWADCNNDGYLDFARNSAGRFEVYLNKGPDSIPAYSFGDVSLNPNLVITAIPDGMNVEGFGWLDYNGDSWLDLVIENHSFGIDIYENPADGTANFFHVTPNASSKGLPTGGTSGDYMTLGDYNDDGYVDILARKENEFDLWTNSGSSTFVSNASFNEQATNGNKGGVLFCDFDNDGDMDIFWGDGGTSPNQIWEQTGINSGSFAATNEPATSSGVTPLNVDGCACGDVDNDGDIDLFLASNSGTNYLYLNDTSASSVFLFTQNNLGINVNGNAEGCAFGDYDNDGDMDLYINVTGAGNQLWRNGINDTNYLKVRALRCLAGNVFRDDIGATVVLKNCAGNVVSGIREVNGTKGYGSQNSAIVHFGLPDGPDSLYYIEVRFTDVLGQRDTVKKALIPSQVINQTLTITNCDTSVFVGCSITVDAGKKDTICIGDSVVIGNAQVAIGGTPPYTYMWSPGVGLNDPSLSNPSASPITTTDYVVLVIDSFGLSNTDTVKVVVSPSPNVVAGNDGIILAGDTIQLNVTGAVSYIWSPSSSLSCTNCSNPKAFPIVTTTYYVVGKSADSCSRIDSVTLTVTDEIKVIVYNALSPNRDGLNDKLIIQGIDYYPNNKLTIYNRWGDQLIKIKNYDNVTKYWEGRNKDGKHLPDGVYYYILRLNDDQELTGFIQLKNE